MKAPLYCLIVAAAASPALGQTVECTGTESGGDGPRQYSYPVIDATLSMTHLYIGTEDGTLANYTNELMPTNWDFEIVANSGLEHNEEKTCHGLLNQASGGCDWLIHFYRVSGSAGLPGGFTFGFNHPWTSHDVEWEVRSDLVSLNTATWAQQVGEGLGPVHGPVHCKGRFPVAGNDCFASGASFKVRFLDGSTVSCTGLTDPGTIVGRSDPFTENDPADDIDEPCLFPTSFPEEPDTRRELHTEIVSLILTGSGGCEVRAGAAYENSTTPEPPPGYFQRSLGEVASLDDGDPVSVCNDFPADSFFNMYVQVLAGPYELYNITPMVVRAEITQFPPDLDLPQSTYIHDPTFPPVPLYDRFGNHVAYLLSAGHGSPENLEALPPVEMFPLIPGPVTFGVDELSIGLDPAGSPPNHVWDDKTAPEKTVTAYQSSGAVPGNPPDTTNMRVPELVGQVQDPDLPPVKDFIATDAIGSFSFGRDGTEDNNPKSDLLHANFFFSVTRTAGSTQAIGCANAVAAAEPLDREAASVFASGVPPFGVYPGVVTIPIALGTNVLATGDNSLGLRGGDDPEQDNVIALEIEDYDAQVDRYYLTLTGEAAILRNDCNGNGHPDSCDIDGGTSLDSNGNGVPDECEGDCNNNGIADACDIDCGVSKGPCDVLDCGGSTDGNGNGVPDECEPDCNGNGLSDACDISCGVALGPCDLPGCGGSSDDNNNGSPDECERTNVIFVYENQSHPGPLPLCDLHVFAPADAMGLDDLDVIDALVLSDVTRGVEPSEQSPNGIMDADADEVLFSLAPGSPTLGTPGNTAADIFYSDFDTTFSIYADASVLGLTDDADVDAADIGPAAKGACYEPPEGEARCVEVTLRQCKDAGWWYDGDDTECALPTDIPKIGACCHGEPRGSLCTVNTRAWCVGNGGAYRGDDSICKEDLNNDGIFDTCEAIPAASEWGLAILMLLTMVLGTIAIRRYSLAAPGV